MRSRGNGPIEQPLDLWSKEDLTRALQSAGVGVWRVDLRAGIAYYDEQDAQLLGLPPRGVCEFSEFIECVHPDDRGRVEAAIGASTREKPDFQIDFRANPHAGFTRCIRDLGRVDFDEDGNAIGMSGICFDVTWRVESERQMQTLMEERKLALDVANVGTWWYDAKTDLNHLDERCREILGVPNAVALKLEELAEYIHPEDLSFALEKAEETSSPNAPDNYEVDYRIIRPDGRVRHISIKGIAKWSSDGGERVLVGYLGTVVDDTEQQLAKVALEQEVRRQTQDLLRANRELESFAYSVSHDLRAPLRTIASTSAILLEDHQDILPPESINLLKRQTIAAQKLASMVDGLLELSRIVRHELNKDEINLTQKVWSVWDDLKVFCGEHITLSVEEGLRACADPALTRVLIQNLLENACKFSPDGGQITVGCKDGAFYVKDEGVGFDATYVDKIFKPFERLVRDEEYAGYGIGLANVQRIVERHGGRVWAESTPGDGATFYFTLQ